jgi:hypothetical protein
MGNNGDRLASMRAELKSGRHRTERSSNTYTKNYSAEMNERGIAVISNLPAGRGKVDAEPGRVWFVAHCDGYEPIEQTPELGSGFFAPRPLITRVLPGQTERMTVRMRKIVPGEIGSETELQGSREGIPGGPVVNDDEDSAVGAVAERPVGISLDLDAAPVD